ncbi:MAG TPA: hypothetical protein VFF73_22290 [Planctomycetota bacterium]|nr:hypothetical protein [Planctomycetota bacterium]
MFGWIKHNWKAVLVGAAATLAVAGVVALCVVGAPAIGAFAAAAGAAALAFAATTGGRVVVGAAIGAAVNSAAYAGIQLWRGQPLDMKTLGAAAIGGAVAGGLAGSTFGASLLAGGSTTASEFLAIDGGAASGTEKMASNAFAGKALGDGVPEAVAWGAVTAPVTGIALRGVGTELSKLASEAGTSAATDASTAASTAEAAAPSAAASVRATVAHHVPVPAVHAIGSSIANLIFGAPWVGEAVQIGKSSSNAKPVDPNQGGGSPSSTKGITGSLGQ